MSKFVKVALKSFPRPMFMLKRDTLNLHKFENHNKPHLSSANGSSGGVRNPPPKSPLAKLGCKALTDLMIQFARFFSFLEQT